MAFRFRLPSAAIITGSAVSLIVLGASPAGCAADVRIGITDPDAGAAPVPFEPPDASDASSEPRLCATAECPAGTTTCATSRARCDVDVTTDRDNCGACGAACPPDQYRPPWGEGDESSLQVKFSCVDSRCAVSCQGGFGDCDGIPDNGCEADLAEPGHCGACGNACAPGIPCVEGKCGCNAPEVVCAGACTDRRSSIAHCGACGNACEDTAPRPSEHNMEMSCIGGECKHACRPGFADCNGDPSDGCEKDLRIPDEQNCGECGETCPTGVSCDVYDDVAHRLRCGCPPGQNKCGAGSHRHCVDALTDPTNCGGCGVICTSDDRASARPVCRAGICGIICKDGHGDCNGFGGDGCEISLDSDPLNCGACGHACDAEIGQPCVGGKCVEAECGGGAR